MYQKGKEIRLDTLRIVSPPHEQLGGCRGKADTDFLSQRVEADLRMQTGIQTSSQEIRLSRKFKIWKTNPLEQWSAPLRPESLLTAWLFSPLLRMASTFFNG